jgi:hypothetical protein
MNNRYNPARHCFPSSGFPPRQAVLVCLLSAALPIAFGQVTLTTTQIAKRVSLAVVVIEGKTDSGGIQGSGFTISKDGKIATSLHVIKDLTTATVRLADGQVFDSVSVLAVDERRDLAIIKVAGFNLTTLQLGDSDTLTVGERVVVVGSPLGLKATVTAGILSAIRDSGEGFKVLQTDAAVNHGNSGGPLVAGNGLAVGVVSFILPSAQGLNFAVPINYIRGLLDNLHDPMTLRQMQQKLVSPKSAPQQGSGPSLKETLDWLKEKIPLSAGHTVLASTPFSGPSGSKDITFKYTATQIEVCTVILDHTETTAYENLQGPPAVQTIRYTLPLGSVMNAYTFRDDSPLSLAFYHFATWSVVLETESNVILSETHEPWYLIGTTKNESTKTFIMTFNEESIAMRVLEAFKHAADLCRGKEPF